MQNLLKNDLHGFHLVESQYIDELKATGFLLEHIKSGAKLFYVDAKDDNKVFSISFRTPPTDSTGVAHIMEHSVLCGSRKFPLKEPFVELVKGSLNTFLNAMTFPDKTMYPIASKNDKDFRNLMDVYLDAAFYPRVLETPEIVMQEGWHYEMDEIDQPMSYKGVVYNEMKGVYSTPTSILNRKAMEALFKDTTYGVDSGGDPDHITDLTFENFVNFYKKNYHPSNSYFFLYGTMDIVDHLRFINEEYLQNFDRIEVDSQIGLQEPFEKAVELEAPYNISTDESTEAKTMHALAYAFPPSSTAFNLAMEVLNYVIVGSQAAPLREILVKEGVGNDISGSYTDGIYQPTWEIVATGSERADGKRLKKIVREYLEKVCCEGLDKKALEAAINYFEFVLREADFGGHAVGLIYNIRAMGTWLYDGSPFDALRYEEALKTLRAGLNTRFYEELIEKYILNNEHNVLMTLYPKRGLTAEKTAKEEKYLAELKAKMSKEELESIVKQTKDLKARQAAVDSPEALATIPLLELSDVNTEVEKIAASEMVIDDVRLHHVDTNTNGIAYANYYFDMNVLNEEEIQYANLLSDVLRRMNTAYHSYTDLEQMIQFNLGGMAFSTIATPIIKGEGEYKPAFVVRAKSLAQNIEPMWKIVDEIINYTILNDEKRVGELVAELKAIWDTDAVSKGHTIASIRTMAQVTNFDKFKDACELKYFEFLSATLKKGNFKEVGKKMQAVAEKLFTTAHLDVLFTGDKEDFAKFVACAKSTMKEWNHTNNPLKPIEFSEKYVSEGIATSGQIQYVAQGGSFKEHGVKFTGAMKVLEMILKYEHLWTKIRIQGGAYGAFASFKADGAMIFCSYRDPNLENTLNVYKDMYKYIENITLTERELRKYIIGTMSSLDKPMTPYLRGVRYIQQWFAGTNEKDVERLYSQVVSTDEAQLRELAKVVKEVIDDKHICVLGNEEKVKAAKDCFEKIISLPN